GAWRVRGVTGGQVGGVVVVEPGRGVDGFGVRTAGTDLEVQVRAGALPAGADVADVLAGGDGVADGDVDAVVPHVNVGGRDLLTADGVLDDDDAAAGLTVVRDGDDPVGRGEDRGAVRGGEVGTGVQLPFATDGRSEEHTSELQSRFDLVCRLL